MRLYQQCGLLSIAQTQHINQRLVGVGKLARVFEIVSVCLRDEALNLGVEWHPKLV
jgi:hypothetical protein